MCQIFYLSCIKYTWFCLGIWFFISKFLYYKENILFMLLYILGIHKNVLEITDNKIIKKFTKYIIYQMLKVIGIFINPNYIILCLK